MEVPLDASRNMDLKGFFNFKELYLGVKACCNFFNIFLQIPVEAYIL